MTTDEIIAAAREADPGFDGGPDADGTMADSLVGIKAVERFYAIAYRAGMERAADLCSHLVLSHAGNAAATAMQIEQAIRAHAKNQPESTHDTGNV